MILEYKVPRVDPSSGEYSVGVAYGVPVEVFVLGKRQRVIYQLPGAGQVCAVVHLASGQVLAYVTDEHTGYPETKAQTAVNERLQHLSAEHVAQAYAMATVLNPSAKQVDVLLRYRKQPAKLPTQTRKTT